LGRPSDFRAERLEPVASQLEDLLDVAAQLGPEVLIEIERDFSAASLHVGESKNDLAWLKKVIDLRRATLARLRHGSSAWDLGGGETRSWVCFDCKRVFAVRSFDRYRGQCSPARRD